MGNSTWHGPDITEIESGLYISNAFVSRNLEHLLEHNVGAVLSLTETKNYKWTRMAYREQVAEDRHVYVPCRDSLTEDFLTRLPDLCDFIGRMRAQDHRVLVHCVRGVSRSPMVVVGYLMRRDRQSLQASLDAVKARRKVRPNENFMEQLAVWEEVGYELWEDSEKTTPKPPYASWLAKRAEKLKELGLTGNEPPMGNLADWPPGMTVAF